MSIKKKQLKSGIKYCFTLRYTDIFGNTKQYTSKGYDTKKEAVDEEAKFRIKINEHKVSATRITFDQVFNEYYEYKSKEIKIQSLGKIKNIYKIFEPIGNIKISKFDLNIYRKFRLYIEQKGYSTEYKNKIIGLLRRLIKYSNKFYSTSDDILKYIDNFKDVGKIKKEMEYFTYDEFQKFISVVDEENWKLFFEMLYFMGFRQGELCAITWNDIDFTKKEVSINKTLTTKLKGQLYTISSPKTANSNRVLPIPLKLLNGLKTLNKQAKTRKYYNDSWFVFGNELPFRETTICKRKNKYCKLAEVKQIRIHDFRHSCASFLINRGASIVLVSKYLGHAKVSQTLDIYTHLYKSELLEVSNIIDTL